jgi:hypothetical protein
VLPQIPEPARPACTPASQNHKSISVRNTIDGTTKSRQELQELYEQELW